MELFTTQAYRWHASKNIQMYGLRLKKDKYWSIGLFWDGIWGFGWKIQAKKMFTGFCEGVDSEHALLYPIFHFLHETKVDLLRAYYTLRKIPFTMCQMCGENFAEVKSLDPNSTGILMHMCHQCFGYCGWPLSRGDEDDAAGCHFCHSTQGLLHGVTKPFQAKVHKECVNHRARGVHYVQSDVALQMAEELEIGTAKYGEYKENPFWYGKHLNEQYAFNGWS